MNWKLPAAVVAVILAVALIIPAVESVLPGLGGLTEDLKTGNVSFFNPPKDLQVPDDFDPSKYQDLAQDLDHEFGGLTGESDGGFLPTPGALPDTWNMDRDGGGGNVTIDYVCDPALGAMKRLKTYDAVASDYQIQVTDTSFYPVSPVKTPPTTHTERFRCRFPVLLDPSTPTPIYSVAPDMVITEYSTSPAAGGLSFFRDGADTYYVKPTGSAKVVTNLSITYYAPRSYFTLNVPSTLTLDSYQRTLSEPRPTFPKERVDSPPVVLDEMGLKGERNVKRILETMSAYFNAFGEGDIPKEEEQRDPYLAIALGKNGCCRHRAFAFMVTAHYLGIPTRLVANEAHAYVEVFIPGASGTGGTWQQMNLGGCGTYSVNNRNGVQREYDRDAANPKLNQPPPPPPPANVAATVIEITEYPLDIEKGTPFTVKGTVRTVAGRQPLAGIKVDLFLNETKRTPGYLAGRGVTDSRGVWTINGEVPANAPARPYQLVAHALETKTGDFLYRESWTDPEVRVRAATTLTLELPTSDGRNVEVLTSGTVVDNRGKGVAGASVRLEVDGVLVKTATTDEQGRFKTGLLFPEVRTYTVRASFPGDGYNRPSSDEGRIAISNVAVSLPVAVTAVRGEAITITGTVSTDAGPLRGRAGTVTLPAGFEPPSETGLPFTTDAQGKFTVRFTPGKRLPLGPYDLEYLLPGVGSKAQVVEVVQRPQLALAAPQEISGDRAIEVRAVLVDDQRAPIAGAPLFLTLPGTTFNVTARTAPDGTASFTIPADRIPEDDFTPVVTFPGSPGVVKAQATATVAVATGLGPWPWILGGVALAALAVGAVILGSRRLRSRLFAAAKQVGRSPVAVEVTHPNLPPHLPQVVGPGEAVAFRLAVRHRKADQEGPLADAPLAVQVAGVDLALSTDGNGVAEFMHTFHAVGDYPLTVKVGATKGVKATTHIVPFRVVEYRRQIEDQYVDLMARMRADGVPVPEGATPRDLERALLAAGAEPPEALATMATVFEVADYSERPVTRAEWRTFSEACRQAEVSLARLRAPPEAPGQPEVAA